MHVAGGLAFARGLGVGLALAQTKRRSSAFADGCVSLPFLAPLLTQ